MTGLPYSLSEASLKLLGLSWLTLLLLSKASCSLTPGAQVSSLEQLAPSTIGADPDDLGMLLSFVPLVSDTLTPPMPLPIPLAAWTPPNSCQFPYLIHLVLFALNVPGTFDSAGDI